MTIFASDRQVAVIDTTVVGTARDIANVITRQEQLGVLIGHGAIVPTSDGRSSITLQIRSERKEGVPWKVVAVFSATFLTSGIAGLVIHALT